MVWSRGGRGERARKVWAVALCGGSFLAGQLVWGGEPGSLLDGYLQSASQISAELNTLQPTEAPVGNALGGVPLVEAKPLPVQEAKPLPVQDAKPLPAGESKLRPVKQAVVLEAPSFKNPVAPASNSEEEHLAPIVPAWAMPRRPGDRGQGTGVRSQAVAVPAIKNPFVGPPQPLKIEIGKGSGLGVQGSAKGTGDRGQATGDRGQKPEASPGGERVLSTQYLVPSPQQAATASPELKTGIQHSEFSIQNSELSPQQPEAGLSPKIQNRGTHDSGSSKIQNQPIVTAQAEVALPPEKSPEIDTPLPAPIENPKSKIQNEPALAPSPVRTAEFEARLFAQPEKEVDAFRKATANKEEEFGKLPEGSPFEAIPQSGSVKLRVRRSVLLRTKVDIYRTAIVDQTVCDIVQFTPREVSIIGRSVGQTHVTFWFDDANMAPLTYLVEVKADAEQVKADEDKYQLLENVINEMFPDSKIHLVIVADKLLVKGQAKDSEEAAQIMNIVRAQGVRGNYGNAGYGGIYGSVADALATPVLSQAATGGNPGPGYQIINMLRVPGVQQVALKVKIADLNRSAARGFGIDVSGTIDLSDSINGSKLFLASLLNASATGGTALITQFDGDDINVGVRFLQERGVIKLLSEPTLVTLSGRPATFVAGGEFAVPTIVGSVGLNAVTTDFRSFGAIISFLPTIVDKDRIRLQVAPEFSQLNRQLSVNNTPGLNVRAATTTVEMREGQTLAIAGLLEDSYSASTVGNLPGLAKLFGRRDTTRSETELIILVTPELVHPMEPEEVPPLPGFDVTEPTACQFFFCGEIEGNPTQDYRSTVWPRLRKRYGMGGPAMTSGPFGHGQ